MRLHYKTLHNRFQNSLSVRKVDKPCFDESWHFHPELELIYILKGEGTRFVGNNISRFAKNDFVLLGPNLPHLWRNDEKYLETSHSKEVSIIIIHFSEHVLGENFFSQKEMSRVKHLFEQSVYGVKFSEKTAAISNSIITNMLNQKGVRKIILFMELLDVISKSEDNRMLSPHEFNSTIRASEKERIDKVINFVFANFKDKIRLETIAQIANMSPGAFCRFFKKRAKKPFSQFLNEIRINHSCKLLIEGDLNVNEVCYLSGFSSISNFNRHFKHVIQETPLNYKKKYKLGY